MVSRNYKFVSVTIPRLGTVLKVKNISDGPLDVKLQDRNTRESGFSYRIEVGQSVLLDYKGFQRHKQREMCILINQPYISLQDFNDHIQKELIPFSIPDRDHSRYGVSFNL